MRVAPVLILLVDLATVQNTPVQPAKTPRFDFHGDPLPEGAVARLGTSRFVTPDGLNLEALSADGTTVVMASAHPSQKKDTRIEFMSTSTGKIERTLVLSDVVYDRAMQFIFDGKKLTIASNTGVKVFDAESGKLTKSIDLPKAGRANIALSPDGKWVACKPGESAEDSQIYIYEMSTGKQVAAIPTRIRRCYDLAFSKDGKRLLFWALIDNSGPKVVVACIDIEKQKIDGMMPARVDIEDPKRGTALGTDGETVALTVDGQKDIAIQHLPTGKTRCVIRVNSHNYAFTPDGSALCTIDENYRAALWSTATGVKIRDLEGGLTKGIHTSFDFLGISQDGSTIAAYDGSHMSAPTIVIWNAATGKRVGRPMGHEGTVSALAYVPGSKLLATGGMDHTVRLWNAATGEHLRLLTTHDSLIMALAVSPDGKFLASEGHSGVIRVTNVADGKVVREIVGPRRGSGTLAFSPDGTILFASDVMLAWQNPRAKEAAWLKAHEDHVIALGAANTLALTREEGGTIEKPSYSLRVWDTTRKRPGVSLTPGDKGNRLIGWNAATFSPNGQMIASGQTELESPDRPPSYRLGLWDRVTGDLIHTLSIKGSMGVVEGADELAFSPDGRYLVSGHSSRVSFYRGRSLDPGVDIHDVITGKKVSTLQVIPSCVAYSSDGTQVATGTRGGTILIWEAPKVQVAKRTDAPTAAVRDAWWPALGGNAKVAYAALGVMIEVPEQAVEFLKGRISPVQPSDPDKTAKLIRQLDSDIFAEREQAQKDLEKMGEGAAAQLGKALEGEDSLEARRRIQALLDKFNENSVLGRQQLRSVALLEWIATPAARKLLRELAGGAPEARLTTEARAALKRMESR